MARILTERPELAGRLQLTHIFNRGVARKRACWVPGSVTWTEDVDELFASKPDAVVEVVGGIDPAGGWVRRAPQQGASVVTANKQLLAAHGLELLHLAVTNHSQLRFEAAVAGGVPLIYGVREGLAGDRLTRVAGILNGTSNFVLSTMAMGDAQMAACSTTPGALVRGGRSERRHRRRRRGAKLVVLAGIAPPSRQAARHSAAFDPSDLGCRLPIRAGSDAPSGRLRWQRRPEATAFTRFVAGPLVLRGSNFGLNMGANNVVAITGHYGGENSFSGAGAGGPATAVAVVSDLLSLTQRDRDHGKSGHRLASAIAPGTPCHLRFVVDRPGILASIAAALARQGINLDAVLQEPGYPKDALPFVITVEPCEEPERSAWP